MTKHTFLDYYFECVSSSNWSVESSACILRLLFRICFAVELISRTNSRYWCKPFLTVQMTGQENLRDKCLGFILSNFDTVMQAYDWPFMTLAELQGFLTSSDMMVHSETKLWSHVEAWLLHDANKDHLCDNLRYCVFVVCWADRVWHLGFLFVCFCFQDFFFSSFLFVFCLSKNLVSRVWHYLSDLISM